MTLEAMVQALQEQPNQTSRNSSRPPSSDPPQHQRSSRPRGKRRRGGQPGHPGHTRTLLPVNEVDEVVVLKPDECPSCHAPLAGDDPTPWRHQVIELPPITPVVTEYQWHQLVCAACGEVSRAPWPSGVPSGTYGPRVQATVALCTGAYRLPKRTTQQMMAEGFGVPMSVGTVSQLERAPTTVFRPRRGSPDIRARAKGGAPRRDQLASRSPGSVVMGCRDHVGDRVCGAAVPRWARGSRVIRQDVAGILVTDRYSAYKWYPVRWRQVCWAHLLRDFEAMRDRGGCSEAIGDALLAQARQMFTWWHRVREGTLQHSTFRSYMTPLRREVERLLEAGRHCGMPKTAGTC